MRLKRGPAAIFLLLLLLSGILFLMFGCREREPESPLPRHSGNYTTSADIRYRTLSAKATITQADPSSCSVVFESPQSLRDMTFVFTSDNVELGYKGLSFSFDASSLPGGAIANMAVASINKAMSGDGLTVKRDGDALVLDGVMESGEFCLRIDRESGNLLKLSVPSEEFEIEFANFHFLD